MKPEPLSFRPYARLLTMLGDQLIKNERIALVELIKNAYDADADRVEVRFENFNRDMTFNRWSRIVVRDDGLGMHPETMQTHWMNPATPHKYQAKRSGAGKTPGKNRTIQGDKGIGRFAVLKLGRTITITTRTRDAHEGSVLIWDFSRFDDEFLSENRENENSEDTEAEEPQDAEETDIFLDQIKVRFLSTTPTALRGNEHGTVLEIDNLKGNWDDDTIERLCRDVSNLTDPVSRISGSSAAKDFKIEINCNGALRQIDTDYMELLKVLIEDKAVLKIQGRFRSTDNTFAFQTEGQKNELCLQDTKITGLWVWRQRFGKARGPVESQIPIPFPHDASISYTCGDFSFQFYIFDFSRGIDGRYALAQTEKNRLKEHRIYLYRDDVRVYPYGDPDDDWLNIDVTRGTGRAGDFFSNDQIIGWIDITQKGNPNLRDKTNREGLIEAGNATRDLVFLVQTFLSYVKQYPFARYQQKQYQRSIDRFIRDGVVAQHLSDLREGLKETGHESQARAVTKIEAEYEREKKHLSQRAEVTEDLAGVGLSVEMASHDIMLLMARAQDVGKRLARTARTSGSTEVQEQADMLVGVLQQIVDGMRDVQSLFKSSRRRRKSLRVEPVLDKIHQIYKTLLEQRNIRYEKSMVPGSPLVANTTDGVVMQVLINLFDNASYWLDTVDPGEREIRVTVDGERGKLLFSDSGPGIDPEDLPYIFEPFYTGKGQEGRGLGLYIARQLLERHDYRIATAEDRRKILPGANFVVSFVKEEA